MLVLQQMIIFVLLMAVGALARHYQILTPENQPQITRLVVNIAYPAIILSGVTGKDALIYMTVLLIPFNLLFFSYVIQTIKGSSSTPEPFRWRNLLNTGMGACVLAIIVYLANIQLPYVLAQSISMVGSRHDAAGGFGDGIGIIVKNIS